MEEGQELPKKMKIGEVVFDALCAQEERLGKKSIPQGP